MARQSKWPYSKETADLICDLVAEGQNLHRIGKLDGYPPRWRIQEWLNEQTEFATNYARAREDRADWRAARVDEITQRLLNGEIDPGAARVAIDAEKWQAGHEKPKTYAPRASVELEGNPDKPLNLIGTLGQLSVDDLRKLAVLGTDD